MKKQYSVLAIVTLSILIAVISLSLLITQKTKAQDAYAGQKWEYLEISTTEPATFATVVGTGYFLNGEFRTHSKTDLPLHGLINYLGTQGWEMVADVNNQIFIFKRPLP